MTLIDAEVRREQITAAGWGIDRAKLKPGMTLLQGPHGDRAFQVETCNDPKVFTGFNILTGLRIAENYEWLWCYRELDALGIDQFKKANGAAE